MQVAVSHSPLLLDVTTLEGKHVSPRCPLQRQKEVEDDPSRLLQNVCLLIAFGC